MIKIIAPGKIKDKHLEALIDEYLKRISKYHKIQIIEVKDEMISANDSIENIKNKEGKDILSKVNDGDYVICLDLNGKMIDSIALSKKIDETFNNHACITFIIGGSLGLSEEVLSRANYKWKLSDLTFLHQMVRYIILEQIYRSFKILNNETYHK